MQVSDITDQIRGHLLDSETMVEEPSDYFGDRMLSITTRGVPVRAYIIDGLYALAASDVIEAWRPGDQHADQTIDAVLDYARRGGKPAPPPNPNEVFAAGFAFLRPLLQEGESLSAVINHNNDPELLISGASGTTGVWQSGEYWCFTSMLDLGYIRTENAEEGRRSLLRAALDEARNGVDYDSLPHGNR